MLRKILFAALLLLASPLAAQQPRAGSLQLGLEGLAGAQPGLAGSGVTYVGGVLGRSFGPWMPAVTIGRWEQRGHPDVASDGTTAGWGYGIGLEFLPGGGRVSPLFGVAGGRAMVGSSEPFHVRLQAGAAVRGHRLSGTLSGGVQRFEGGLLAVDHVFFVSPRLAFHF